MEKKTEAKQPEPIEATSAEILAFAERNLQKALSDVGYWNGYIERHKQVMGLLDPPKKSSPE